MFRLVSIFAFIVAAVILAGPVASLDLKAYDELTRVFDSAVVMEADIFAPKAFAKANQSYTKATQAVQANKNQKSVNKHVSNSREYIENALKTTAVTKLSLQEYLTARDKARDAKATILVPLLYQKAEKQFLKATAKVESGDVKKGLKEATKSSPLFNVAEMAAIREDILGAADRLIEKATSDGAAKYALTTLDKAHTARRKGNAILINDRYNRKDAVAEARRSEYEARHASNIAMSVRSLKRNDQAWEKLMLVYEIQMNRIGKAIDLSHLPFDDGPMAAADTLIAYITQMQKSNRNLIGDSESLSSGLTTSLREILERFGKNPIDDNPGTLLVSVDNSVAELVSERNRIEKELAAQQVELAALAEKNSEVSSALQVRLQREKKFKKAKSILNPSEGEVLFNSSNDIVLRLSGLSFKVGKSDILDDHISLLEKVKQVIDMFPNSHLVIEGHTDASGEAASNMLLSEKRAFAVMQYLRQSLLIPAGRIRSIGYGADKPVASNKTRDGRSKNRRIDVLIMQ